MLLRTSWNRCLCGRVWLLLWGPYLGLESLGHLGAMPSFLRNPQPSFVCDISSRCPRPRGGWVTWELPRLPATPHGLRAPGTDALGHSLARSHACGRSIVHVRELCSARHETAHVAQVETHLTGIWYGCSSQRVSPAATPTGRRAGADARHAFHSYFYFAPETMGTQGRKRFFHL